MEVKQLCFAVLPRPAPAAGVPRNPPPSTRVCRRMAEQGCQTLLAPVAPEPQSQGGSLGRGRSSSRERYGQSGRSRSASREAARQPSGSQHGEPRHHGQSGGGGGVQRPPGSQRVAHPLPPLQPPGAEPQGPRPLEVLLSDASITVGDECVGRCWQGLLLLPWTAMPNSLPSPQLAAPTQGVPAVQGRAGPLPQGAACRGARAHAGGAAAHEAAAKGSGKQLQLWQGVQVLLG